MPHWFKFVAKADTTMPAEVAIYGVIGNEEDEVSAKDFIAEFNAIQNDKITLRISSVGGSVFDGLAIHNAVRAHQAEVTCVVDGIAASSASIVAIAGDKVVMRRNSFLMIHNPMNEVFGNAADLRKEADTLDKFADSFTSMYAQKSGKPAADIKQMMDADTWFDAAEAKAFGLIDSIEGDAAEDEEDDEEDDEQNRLNIAQKAVAKYKNAPEQLRRYAASTPRRKPPQKEIPMAAKTTTRDGKTFVLIGNTEHEIESPVALVDKGAIEAAVREGAEKERTRRAAFSTLLATAGIKGDHAQPFEAAYADGVGEKQIESMVKHFAVAVINNRATPVGEGSGSPEQKEEQDVEKDAKSIRDYCTKRFANEPTMRRRFHVSTGNAGDVSYKAGLDRYVAVETKCRNDEASPAKGREAEDQEPADDAITRVLGNRSIVYSA